MAKPMEKQRKNHGKYEPPPPVQKNIDSALGSSLTALRERLALVDRRSPDYLKSECLMHLIRQAQRKRDDATVNALLPVLLSRCEAILRNKINPKAVPGAEQLREDILQQFVLDLVEDSTEDKPDEITYYECNFNHAFRSLRIDMIRKQGPNHRQLPNERGEDDSVPSSVIPSIADVQLEQVISKDLLSKLSPNERKALILCHQLEYTQVEAAKLCNVDDRTIRNWLKSAKEKLEEPKQD